MKLDRAIELAAGYLERSCDSNGKFVYKVNVATGQQSNSYNVIRHAGAIYALAMYNHAHPDSEAVRVMVRAADYLRKNYVASGVSPDQLAVWSKPVGENSEPSEQYAELGGTALGVVALAEVRRINPSAIPLNQLQALGKFLLFLQTKDGSFVHKYRLKSGSVKNWQSLYYPGEAALAFVYLYEADHANEWLTAAGRSLSYLAKSRVGLSYVPADHWALIATAKLMPYCKRDSCGVSREDLVHHAAQVCNSILQEQLSGTDLDGAFDPTGRTAPAATRLEGLLSALEFIPSGELRRRIDGASGRGIAFLLRAQIKSGSHEGGLPGALVPQAREASDIRVDYLQHALCAWVRYSNFSHERRSSIHFDSSAHTQLGLRHLAPASALRDYEMIP